MTLKINKSGKTPLQEDPWGEPGPIVL